MASFLTGVAVPAGWGGEARCPVSEPQNSM